ncbi:MAG: hypothetical protein JEY99_03980 [Spirochaetales bacterium]|nr:hypothetical protein [Spirochaetales bacterium]
MRETNIKLSAIWIVHFLLWSFGDILSLMQEITVPANNSLLLLVAAPLGVIQVGLILIPFFLKDRVVKITTYIFVPVYLFFNILNIFDISNGWEYLLTSVYIALNILTAVVLFKWNVSKKKA